MNQGSTSTDANRNQESSDRVPDPETLRDAYDEHDGNIAAIARSFDLSPTCIRKHLVRHDIHETQELGLWHRLENELDSDDVGEAAL